MVVANKQASNDVVRQFIACSCLTRVVVEDRHDIVERRQLLRRIRTRHCILACDTDRPSWQRCQEVGCVRIVHHCLHRVHDRVSTPAHLLRNRVLEQYHVGETRDEPRQQRQHISLRVQRRAGSEDGLQLRTTRCRGAKRLHGRKGLLDQLATLRRGVRVRVGRNVVERIRIESSAVELHDRRRCREGSCVMHDHDMDDIHSSMSRVSASCEAPHTHDEPTDSRQTLKDIGILEPNPSGKHAAIAATERNDGAVGGSLLRLADAIGDRRIVRQRLLDRQEARVGAFERPVTKWLERPTNLSISSRSIRFDSVRFERRDWRWPVPETGHSIDAQRTQRGRHTAWRASR